MKTFADGLEPGVQAHSAGVQRRRSMLAQAQGQKSCAPFGLIFLYTVQALFSCTPFRHVDFQQKK